MAHDHAIGLQLAQLERQYPLRSVRDRAGQFHEPLFASEEMKRISGFHNPPMTDNVTPTAHPLFASNLFGRMDASINDCIF
jgi:hypothetical protein